MTKPVAVISNRTKERYEREVGIGVDGVRLVLGGNHVNPRAMRRAARYLRRLLGGAYPKLAASYERGIASPTPPPDPHRIVSLERSLREAADSLEETGELALTIEVSEAIALAGLFRRWENHPAVAPMQTSLVGTDAVYHALATLVTASYLADAGNGVSLRDDVGSHSRVADLWGRPTVTEDFEVEVKSPRALRVDIAESHATDDAAIDIAIRRAFKAAASSRRGQLSQGATGVLALGCFYLSGDALQHVHQVAGEVLHGGTGKPHVAAIAIAAFAMPRSSVTPAMTVNLVPHTRYEGGLTIR